MNDDSRERYDPRSIEPKWQAFWDEHSTFRSERRAGREKIYVLDMFPYPSGEGLHVGHPRGYIATDIYSRHCRMRGKNVLHPMGWDAFGLPAENYALKNKVHPRQAVEKNIANFKSQLSKIGFDYDWSREINTTDPEYYKWTQWIFLQLFKKGLAYQSNESINWCPSCMTGLANEDLDGDLCERCGTKVEKKALPQWVLKITAYADRMLDDLSLLDWPLHIKEAQRNWIGKSEGAEIDFPLLQDSTLAQDSQGRTFSSIKVFTTRPDTLFGATYMVLAPEHALVRELLPEIKNKDEVLHYIAASAGKSDIERNAEGKEKTGVELKGIKAINPANKEEIPVFIADYVFGGYGTGAIMAVPAHDERDLEFAKKFNLPIKDEPFVDGKKITAQVGGRLTTMYKLKDWVFSRQRYWGEPIPIIHCPKDGAVAVPEKDLPVLLPDVEAYEPSGTGESPLATITEWVNTTCPTCGGPAKRETNTMPQWAGSSWYYLRFMDPHNAQALVSKEHEAYWDPVDVYVGGDHAVRHLIYARFWHKFLYDIGAVSVPEPFARLEFLGFILAEDGRKMSKRYGNIINPDDVVTQYGADTFRLYEMFIGPFENTTAWNTNAIVGTARFVERVWRLHEKVADEPVPALDAVVEQTVKKVNEDIEAFKFNTAVSQMMICLNAFEKEGRVCRTQWEKFLQMLAPFAPHVADELWEALGHTESIHISTWPTADASKLVAARATIAVQINGKVRGSIEIAADASEEEALAAARANLQVAAWLAKGQEVKAIYVPGRIINFVLR